MRPCFKVKGVSYFYSRLMYLQHYGVDPDQLEVFNNKYCVNPKHLYLGTHRENMEHASRDKLFVNREFRRKLMREDVIQIRVLYKQKVTIKDIAKRYNITFGYAYRIVTYTNVP